MHPSDLISWSNVDPSILARQKSGEKSKVFLVIEDKNKSCPKWRSSLDVALKNDKSEEALGCGVGGLFEQNSHV